MTRVLGIDPGSRATGYGVVDLLGNRLVHVANGTITVRAALPLSTRLAAIFAGLAEALETYSPNEVSIEGIFHARNALSALKLGHARGVALLAAEQRGLPIAEYTPMQVKSAVVGYGRAEKHQVQDMVCRLLNLCETPAADAADALAVAICHTQSRRTAQLYADAAARRR